MRASKTQDPLTHEIIGAAIEVHRDLGPGLLESVYEDAFCIELEERHLDYQRQQQVQLLYKGRNIGDLYADLVVNQSVIVELKSVEALMPIHTAQLLTYLKLTGLRKGLLINFNVPILKNGIKRVVL